MQYIRSFLLGLIRQSAHGQHCDPVREDSCVVVAELEDAVLHQTEGEHVLVAGVVQLQESEFEVAPLSKLRTYMK